MDPIQPFEECIIVTVEDQSKLALVMELLSHFDLVRARREKLPVMKVQPNVAEPPPLEQQDGFLASYGMWAGRDDIDADALREKWQRDLDSHD